MAVTRNPCRYCPQASDKYEYIEIAIYKKAVKNYLFYDLPMMFYGETQKIFDSGDYGSSVFADAFDTVIQKEKKRFSETAFEDFFNTEVMMQEYVEIKNAVLNEGKRNGE